MAGPTASNSDDAEGRAMELQVTLKGDNFWASAMKRLAEHDVSQLLKAVGPQGNHDATLRGLLDAINSRKRECMKKRWKVTIKDRTIILRDILEKISVWVSKVIKIGDVAVQYDPVSAALPWAAVRLVMQASVNDVEVFGFVLESVESITNVIATCTIFELQYCRQSNLSLELLAQLGEGLVKLYSSILQYLAYVLRYFEAGSAIRFVKSTVKSKSDLKELHHSIEQERSRLWDLSKLAEAEKANSILVSMNQLALQNTSETSFQKRQISDLQQILKELAEPISRVSSGIEAIQDGLHRTERLQILKAISNIPYRLHHKTARNDRLKGSGQWLLKKRAFRMWRAESSSSVLWLHGIPGSGKTKLASLVIDELEQSETVAFFYCMRNPAEPQRGQASKVLASLVRQLSIVGSSSIILPPVVAKYDEALSGFAEFHDVAWSLDECQEVFLELMEYHPSVTVIIDALDEINQEDRQGLLDSLSRLLDESPNLLKIFLSSRDNHDISLRLTGSPNIYIEADDNDDDVTAFIQSELEKARLLNGRLTEHLRTEITHSLIHGARGMFRWVALQIQFLRPLKLPADVLTKLGSLPATLEESYWDIFQCIRASGEHASRLATFIFQWLLYAQGTLATAEIAAIASAHLSAASLQYNYSPSEIFDVCDNLVTRRSNTRLGNDYLELSHLSVREFFENLTNRGIQEFLPSTSNKVLTEACLRSILRSPQVTVLEGSRSRTRYPSSFWDKHVEKCGNLRMSEPLKSLLVRFIFGDGYVSRAFEQWCQKSSRYKRAQDSLKAILMDDNVPVGRQAAIVGSSEPLLLALELNMPEIADMACQLRRLYSDKSSLDPRSLSAQDFLEKSVLIFRLAAVRYWRVNVGICIGRHIVMQCVKGDSQSLQGINPLRMAAQANNTDLISGLLAQEHGGLQAELVAVAEAIDEGHLAALQVLDHHISCGIQTDQRAHIPVAIATAMEYRDTCVKDKAPRSRSLQIVASAIEISDIATDQSKELGQALLCAAAYNKTPLLIRFLLNRGIGLTALSKALAISIANEDPGTSKVLLEHGAKKEIHLAVTGAVINSDRSAAMRLIAAGYPIDAQHPPGHRTALHYAAEKGFQDVISCILQRRIDIDQCDNDGKTPLHVAAEKGMTECVSVLLDYGADVLVRDRAGKLALDLAKARFRESTAALITRRLQELVEFNT